jgi:hypothetical protein
VCDIHFSFAQLYLLNLATFIETLKVIILFIVSFLIILFNI